MVNEDPEIEEMFVQEEQKRRIRKEMMKKKTIGERIKGYQKPLYNYKKVSREFKNKTADETVNETGQNTGHYIDISKIDNLAVVDIDINKAVDEERKERIRQSILLRLPENVGLVQTGNGGLHIYCDRDEYPLKTDSQTKAYKCSDYDIDVFACVNGNRRCLVQADTEIIKYTEEENKYATIYIPEKLIKKAEEESDFTGRYDDSAINQFIEQAETRIRERVKGDSKVIKKYIDLNNYLAKSNLSSLEDILNIFGIDIRYDSSNDDTNIHLTADGLCSMPKEFAEVLVCGLTNVTIHSYCHFSIDRELSLFPLFCAINSLINIESVQDEDIDAYYQEIKSNNILTANADMNWDRTREKCSNKKSTPYALQKIVKIWCPEFYQNTVVPEIRKMKLMKTPIIKEVIEYEKCTETYNYLIRNVTKMSIQDIKQHLLRTFAKLVKGTDVIARMETNIYFVRDAEWFENQLKRFIIPYGVSTITLKQLFVEQFKNFTVYDEVAPVSDLPNIFNTFRMRDPTVYLNNEVKTMIDFLKTTYADEGGEGKGFLTTLRTKVYGNEFSSVNVRFSQLGKEQTKSLLANKLQIQFDELPRIKDGKVVVEDFKILDNDMLSTRSMARDDENITLYFDCDFSTNNSSFAGIYSDEAVRRRLYPIERILSTREDAVEMWKQLWSWIKNEDFIHSYIKYIRESEDIEKNTTFKPYTKFTMPVFFNRIQQSYEDSFDIWLEEFTEEQYNKNLSYERKADGIKGFNAIDLFKNYTKYCSLNKLPSTMNKIGTFNERLKRIYEYDINTIMCSDGVKRRLTYIVMKEDENINQ